MPLRRIPTRIATKSAASNTAAVASAANIDLLGVENGDHRDCSEVIGDGQRRQEDLEPERCARAEDRQHTESKGDVRSHGNPPATSSFAAKIEKREERRRNHHSTNGRGDRQRRLVEGGELTRPPAPV